MVKRYITCKKEEECKDMEISTDGSFLGCEQFFPWGDYYDGNKFHCLKHKLKHRASLSGLELKRFDEKYGEIRLKN